MNFLNKFKSARDSYLMTLLVVGIAVMINFIAAQHFFRFDLTKNKIYAISDASKNIMRDLDDIVTVKAFFSEKLPPNLFAVRQYVGDILDELSSYSKGNLSVQFEDTGKQEVQNEALTLGIPQIQMNIIEKDKLEVKNGFLGIAVMYGTKKEILPVVQDILNTEYDLVAAIKKVIAKEDRVVGYVTEHEEPELTERIAMDKEGESYAILKKALDRNYQVRTVRLSQKDELKGVHTLLVAGSKKAFTADEKKVLETFLFQGGNLVFMLDRVDISRELQATALNLELDDLLAQYGVTPEKKLVLDRSNEVASFSQGFMSFIVPYPYWVKTLRASFEKGNPIVSSLESVIFPWVSPLTLSEKTGVRTQTLIKTTPNAWLASEPFQLEPSLIQASAERSQYALTALLEGEFTPLYPESKPADASVKPGRVLIIPSGRFVTDRFLNQFPKNLAYAMNAIDYLTLDESLIGIRSKAAYDLPLKDLSASSREAIKYVGLLLMPILVILLGLGRFWIYSRRKKRVY